MRPTLEGLLGPPTGSVSVLASNSVDLSTIGELPPVYRAVASLALVSLFGGALLVLFRRFVEESIETSMARPHVSVVYGLIGYGLVAFLGFLVLMQLSATGLTNQPLGYLVAGLDGIGILMLAGLGYTVVGTRLVELVDDRQPWNGLALGAVLSGVVWLLLPPLAAAVVWIGIAAVGTGGPVREWIHAERSVESESGA